MDFFFPWLRVDTEEDLKLEAFLEMTPPNT